MTSYTLGTWYILHFIPDAQNVQKSLAILFSFLLGTSFSNPTYYNISSKEGYLYKLFKVATSSSSKSCQPGHKSDSTEA